MLTISTEQDTLDKPDSSVEDHDIMICLLVFASYQASFIPENAYHCSSLSYILHISQLNVRC